MTLICPRCNTGRIITRDRARKVVGAVGMAAGATTGAAGLFQGAQAGWNAASAISPPSMPYTRIAGALIGGIIGATTGCAIGLSLGELVDDNVLHNYCCLSCRFTFSPNKKRQSTPTTQKFGQTDMADFDEGE